jgi:hypothetical protein
MILNKRLVAASLLCSSLLCVSPAFAQVGGAAGAGSGASASADSASRGTSPTTDNGKNVTSPSTMGGSITGSSGQPAIPGSTAGDSALNNGTSPSGGQPSDAKAKFSGAAEEGEKFTDSMITESGK